MTKRGKKIKVFVWGMVNWNWSLDINAANMAAALDKNRFKVYTMVTSKYPYERISGITYFKRYYPDRIWRFFYVMWGFLYCDVVMIYRMGEFRMFPWLHKVFGTKTFSVLGLVSDVFMREFHKVDSLHALSEHMKQQCREVGIPVKEQVLYNPINTAPFEKIRQLKSKLENIIFIGHDFERKGFRDLVYLAKRVDAVHIHVIGGYENHLKNARELISKESLEDRFTIYGTLERGELLAVMQKCQLHVLPSYKEGRPKAAIESAAAGLPSILYKGYGANEYVLHRENGYIVSGKEEMVSCVIELQQQQKLLEHLSVNTEMVYKPFDLNTIAKSYEGVLEKLVSE